MVSSALVISSIPAVLLFGSLNLLAVALAKRAVSVAVLSAADPWSHLPSAPYDGEDLSTPQGCGGKQEEYCLRAMWGSVPGPHGF